MSEHTKSVCLKHSTGVGRASAQEYMLVSDGDSREYVFNVSDAC